MQHHAHPHPGSQHPHIRHHGHGLQHQQPLMHPNHPLPPRGMNIGPPPPQQPMTPHHRSNITKHPGSSYIPSQQMDPHRLNHQPPRINQQIHPTQMPPPLLKGRPLLSNNTNHVTGLPMPLINHQKPHVLNNNNNNSFKSNNNINSQKKPQSHHQLQKPLQQRSISQPQKPVQILKNPIPPVPQQLSLQQKFTKSPLNSDTSLPTSTSLNSLIPPENNLHQTSTQLSQHTNIVQSKPPQIVQQSSKITASVSNHTSTNSTIQTPTSDLSTEVDTNTSNNRLQTAKNTIRKNKERQHENSNVGKFTTLNTILENTLSDLVNAKEKTPMCLVNELARYNKIQHQYRLTGEQGLAHCKRFTVTLKLGDEEYTSDGQSIKKAQHSAAADAVNKTKYDHPPPKTLRIKSFGRMGMGNITPTVELNALAMKMGQTAIYVFDPPAISPPTVIPNQLRPISSNGQTPHTTLPGNGNHHSQHQQQNHFIPNTLTNYSNNNHHYVKNVYNGSRFTTPFRKPTFGRFHQRLFPFNGHREICKITLIVGKQRFVGVGSSVQAAKHDAATRALEVIKPMSLECNDANSSDNESDVKSPISQVHEMALKRNMSVTFDVQSEIGPPHMKTFITICKVGNIVTEGDGNGKKVSKKRAAEKMLDELRKLPPLSPSKSIPNSTNVKLKKYGRTKEPIVKKRTKTVIKENPEPEVIDDVNPISRLIQIMQGLKEREPVYTVVEENGVPRRREFVIEVMAGGQTARGSGSNKKMAKKNAAQNLLIQMGYETQSSPNKENNPQQLNKQEKKPIHEKIRRMELKDDTTIKMKQTAVESSNVLSHQSGSIESKLIKDNSLTKPNQQLDQPIIASAEKASNQFNNTNSNQEDNKEINQTNKSITSDSLPQNISSTYTSLHKDKLMYLAQILGFTVEFSDYPKGNHGEFLTIVTLSTDPPQICHGAGQDTTTSQDRAAKEALQMITKMGLDNIKPKKTSDQFKDGKNCALEANKI